MYSYLDKLQVGKKALRHLWGGGARVLPIHGEVAPKAPEGARCALQRVLPFMGRWRRRRRRGSLCFATCPPHSWGGGAEGAGGAHVLCNVSHSWEVAPKAPEGLECLTRSRAMQLRSHRPRSQARHRQR